MILMEKIIRSIDELDFDHLNFLIGSDIDFASFFNEKFETICSLIIKHKFNKKLVTIINNLYPHKNFLNFLFDHGQYDMIHFQLFSNDESVVNKYKSEPYLIYLLDSDNFDIDHIEHFPRELISKYTDSILNNLSDFIQSLSFLKDEPANDFFNIIISNYAANYNYEDIKKINFEVNANAFIKLSYLLPLKAKNYIMKKRLYVSDANNVLMYFAASDLRKMISDGLLIFSDADTAKQIINSINPDFIILNVNRFLTASEFIALIDSTHAEINVEGVMLKSSEEISITHLEEITNIIINRKLTRLNYFLYEQYNRKNQMDKLLSILGTNFHYSIMLCCTQSVIRNDHYDDAHFYENCKWWIAYYKKNGVKVKLNPFYLMSKDHINTLDLLQDNPNVIQMNTTMRTTSDALTLITGKTFVWINYNVDGFSFDNTIDSELLFVLSQNEDIYRTYLNKIKYYNVTVNIVVKNKVMQVKKLIKRLDAMGIHYNLSFNEQSLRLYEYLF